MREIVVIGVDVPEIMLSTDDTLTVSLDNCNLTKAQILTLHSLQLCSFRMDLLYNMNFSQISDNCILSFEVDMLDSSYYIIS
jgi:hypothetical protein